MGLPGDREMIDMRIVRRVLGWLQVVALGVFAIGFIIHMPDTRNILGLIVSPTRVIVMGSSMFSAIVCGLGRNRFNEEA